MRVGRYWGFASVGPWQALLNPHSAVQFINTFCCCLALCRFCLAAGKQLLCKLTCVQKPHQAGVETVLQGRDTWSLNLEPARCFQIGVKQGNTFGHTWAVSVLEAVASWYSGYCKFLKIDLPVDIMIFMRLGNALLITDSVWNERHLLECRHFRWLFILFISLVDQASALQEVQI